MIYTRDNRPSGSWTEYRKKATTSMISVTGPFTVHTKEGKYDLPEGWQGFIALDSEGYPYPIDAREHKLSYERA